MKKIILILVVFVLACTQDNHSLLSNQNKRKKENYRLHISEYKLPSELFLCGEQLPLDIPEVKERAEREFYLLLQQPGQIMLYLKRSGRYFPMYEKIIAEKKLPDDLKYLSVAESALYQALSSKSALGLWQFMKGTGRKMGLLCGNYVDERKHPEMSTRAAMEFLKEGYERHNNWLVTLAGYNMGQTGISRSMNYQDGDDYFDLFLNDETSRFIFRIAIIKELMANHEKYGFYLDDEDYYKPYKFNIVKATKVNDLADWAKENNTTYKEVKLLNPWILGRELPLHPDRVDWEIAVPKK